MAFYIFKWAPENHLKVLIGAVIAIWLSETLNQGSFSAIYNTIKAATLFFVEKYAKELSLILNIFTSYYARGGQLNIKF